MTDYISVRALAKRYGTRQVLRDVTLSVARADVVGVIGPNGSGKTTLLRILVGLLRPDSGGVWLDGLEMRAALAGIRVGYFAGESTIPPHLSSRSWRALFQSGSPIGEVRQVRVLSRGNRQLLGLRTLFSLSGLRLIVLDEPWEGLDPDASRCLSESIRVRRDAGTTIVVSSHRLHDLAGVCDRYVFLEHGVATAMSAADLGITGAVNGEALLAAFDALRGRAR